MPDLIILFRHLNNLGITQKSSIRGDSSASRVEQGLVKNDSLSIDRDYFRLELSIVGSLPEELLSQSSRWSPRFNSWDRLRSLPQLAGTVGLASSLGPAFKY